LCSLNQPRITAVQNPYLSTKLDGATNTLLPCETHLGLLTDTGLLSKVAAFTKTP
jgi:triacylglycerol lipase